MDVRAILAEWNRCRDWLLPALTDATEDEVIDQLICSRAQLWGGDRAAAVTQLVDGAEPYVLVWLAGGEMFEMIAMGPLIESWARQQGVKAMRINGRKGWNRMLRPMGFKRHDGELRKVL